MVEHECITTAVLDICIAGTPNQDSQVAIRIRAERGPVVLLSDPRSAIICARNRRIQMTIALLMNILQIRRRTLERISLIDSMTIGCKK